MITRRLYLPWSKPPLSLNDRLHWAAQAEIKRMIRLAVGWLVRAAGIGSCAHVDVTLVWAPGDHRRRDADNPAATLKACCDGLVDAGVVPDDTPAWMSKRMPVILTPDDTTDRGLWLDLVLTPAETAPDAPEPPEGHRATTNPGKAASVAAGAPERVSARQQPTRRPA